MRRIFWGFCRNWFLIDPLHYLSSRSDFGFEFAEIFVIEKRLPDSPSRGAGFECLKENSASLRVVEQRADRLAMVTLLHTFSLDGIFGAACW
jgi:hypothetical protein